MTTSPAGRRVTGEREAIEAAIAGATLLTAFAATARRDLARTADALDANGWLHTGDIGTLDADGMLRIVDRKQEVIITSGGKNVSPATVEALLQGHPLIGQACAVGDRRNYVTALVVLDGEAAPVWAREHGIPAAVR